MSDDPSDIARAMPMDELRDFAVAQTVASLGLLEELKKISEPAYDEVMAAFLAYRRTMHDRFGTIHEQMNSIDLAAEQQQERILALERAIAPSHRNWKLLAMSLLLLLIVGVVVIRAILMHW